MANEPTILLISPAPAFCAAARREFEAREGRLRVAAVSNIDAARRVVADTPPTAILLDDASLGSQQDGPEDRVPGLEAVVSALAVYAPVVIIGAAERRENVSALVASGAADFVARAGGSLLVALGLLERRLRQAQSEIRFILEPPPRNAAIEKIPAPGEEFGEILRHELNNPLTGILGNAELLLSSIRRRKDGRTPEDAQQRLETIAALAVRLRESVRRLSQGWEAQQTSGQTAWTEVKETAKI